MPGKEKSAEGCNEDGDRDDIGDTQIWYSEECKQSTPFVPCEFHWENILNFEVRDEGVYDVQVCESLCNGLLCCESWFGLQMIGQVLDEDRAYNNGGDYCEPSGCQYKYVSPLNRYYTYFTKEGSNRQNAHQLKSSNQLCSAAPFQLAD